ncbi:RsiV family protein, partial [Blautia wexlerae]|nr:RsiV family protein [Blautia wexlerae]
TSYNLDPATGAFYGFRDLFRNPDTAVQTATAKIQETIRSFDLDESMIAGAVQTVQEQNGDFSYYLSGDQLVIYYQPYDIAPYAAGLIRIPIPLSELGETVVPLRHTPERGSVRVNGKDTSVSRKLLLNENGDATVLLPMPEIARLCGVEATIKNESCMIAGKEYAVTYANGGAYISLYDLLDAIQNDVPGCLVVYGQDEVLRMYTEA